jgi:multidrug efflux pump subunit AcrA (membrane-fusion protein)
MNSFPVFLSAAAILLFSGACTKLENSGNEQKGQQKGKSNRPPQLVELYELKESSLPDTLRIPVVLEGRYQLEVFARGQGRIHSLEVAQGSFVRSGSVLYSLDRSEPGESYLPAPAVSPASGKLAQWYVVKGSQVTPQSVVALLVDDSFLRAKVPVPLDYWQRVTLNTESKIVREGKIWPGKIVSLPKAVASGSNRVDVEIEIENSRSELRAGLSAQAEFTLNAVKRVLLPAKAVLLTNEGAFVFSVVDNVLVRIAVRMQPVSLDWVEIIEPALVPGQSFVVSGFSRLSAGSKVRTSSIQSAKPDEEKREAKP